MPKRSSKQKDVNVIASEITEQVIKESETGKNPHAVALHFMYYNFARPHQTLANPYPTTPAMAVGVSDHIWTIEEIARLT